MSNTIITEFGAYPNMEVALSTLRVKLNKALIEAEHTAQQRKTELRLFYGALELLHEQGNDLKTITADRLFEAASRRDTRLHEKPDTAAAEPTEEAQT